MFITVACGAISGFHATQSPMIAKCMTGEKEGRRIFYGAMICESVIALVWAAGGVAFYGATGGLNEALSSLGQSGTVYEISTGLLGTAGGVLAIVGVVACPITSGDTAFRSARLIISEVLGSDQKYMRNRLIITIPLLAAGVILTQLDFNVLWRYFSWSNQTLAMISLWVATAYLLKNKDSKWISLITAMPAAFMSAVIMTYILTVRTARRGQCEDGVRRTAADAAVFCIGEPRKGAGQRGCWIELLAAALPSYGKDQHAVDRGTSIAAFFVRPEAAGPLPMPGLGSAGAARITQIKAKLEKNGLQIRVETV